MIFKNDSNVNNPNTRRDPQADLGLWANLGIKSLTTTDTIQKKIVERRSKGPIFAFFGSPGPPGIATYAVRGTGPPGSHGLSSFDAVINRKGT